LQDNTAIEVSTDDVPLAGIERIVRPVGADDVAAA
jgi:hypothetical protein